MLYLSTRESVCHGLFQENRKNTGGRGTRRTIRYPLPAIRYLSFARAVFGSVFVVLGADF